MSKRKFNITVYREDVYQVELDTDVMTEEWMKEFRDYFYDFDGLEQHAEHIATMRARFGELYMEGYGYPLIDGKEPVGIPQYMRPTTAFNINIIDEDNTITCDVKELNE